MRKNICSIFIILVISNVMANEAQKALILNQITEHITIDGIIEPAWELADSVSDFTQHQPYYGIKPSRKTVAKIITNEENNK